MSAKVLMVMGTGSDVGKSLIVAGLCRAFANRGLNVAPFKPQNMSNNAAVTADGGEIGRAQALQARAARREPVTAMNPVLLKPEHDSGAQIIVRGQRVGAMSARQYFATRQKFLPAIVDAFNELAKSADLVLVEGAGSASEVNLRDQDLANFGFAQAVGAPVVLVGDIERGGVIASLLGTLEVIAPQDRALVKALLVNKFRGDPQLFAAGIDILGARSGLPVFGPVPMFEAAADLPAEDALSLETRGPKGRRGRFRVAILRLARIANFDDFDPLLAEPDLDVQFIGKGEIIPRDADLVIIPGTKATLADLRDFKAQGWDIDLAAHIRAGGHVLGICGGYQMLGRVLADPQGLEGPPQTLTGLGWLDVETVLEPVKQLRIEEGHDAQFGEALSGYHMHMGRTNGPDREKPFARIGREPEGAIGQNGRVMGTYLHGLFAADGFRQAFFKALGAAPDVGLDHHGRVEAALEGLARHLQTHLDLDALLDLAGPADGREPDKGGQSKRNPGKSQPAQKPPAQKPPAQEPPAKDRAP